jgi:hypothetical protein
MRLCKDHGSPNRLPDILHYTGQPAFQDIKARRVSEIYPLIQPARKIFLQAH